MLPKPNRFSFKKKVPRKIIQTPYMTIRYEGINGELKGAVVISKKASKKATDRNRMKRILSEQLGQHKSLPYSIVLFVKKEAFLSEEEIVKSTLGEMLNSLVQ